MSVPIPWTLKDRLVFATEVRERLADLVGGDLPMVVDRVAEALPHVDMADRLMAIAVVLSFCRHCHERPADGCQCWNDE